jgi:hypothetical protein
VSKSTFDKERNEREREIKQKLQLSLANKYLLSISQKKMMIFVPGPFAFIRRCSTEQKMKTFLIYYDY